MNDAHYPSDLPLGRQVVSSSSYDTNQLRPIPRKIGREAIGIFSNSSLPFLGEDIWNCWELSWLDPNGKPVIAVAEIRIPVKTPNMVESKSLKLYLNSFSMTRLNSPETLRKIIARDIGRIVEGTVSVQLILPEAFGKLRIMEPEGICIDHQHIDIKEFSVSSDLLAVDNHRVSEILFSRLIRTNCPVTGQPDWATVCVKYTGPRIRPDSLLCYFVSFRQTQGFHESCVETMFCHILEKCKPEALTLSARFTRRGGIDINPFRSTETSSSPNYRDPRQ
jgi:7-cyano-7-deazaguanine reductase